MADKIFLQTFLFGVAITEWIEITKVGNANNKRIENSKESTYTLPSYEITMERPQLYEITTKEIENHEIAVSSRLPSGIIGTELQNYKKQKISEPNRDSNSYVKLNDSKNVLSINNKIYENLEIKRINVTKSNTGSTDDPPKTDIHNNDKASDNKHLKVENHLEKVFEESIEGKKINETQNENIIGHILMNDDEHVSIEDEDDYYEDEEDYEEYEDVPEGDEDQTDKVKKQEDPIDRSSGFISIIKHIQHQLLDFKGRTLNAKVEHLKKLRDNILHEIKFRISQLFKTPEKSESESRIYKDFYSDEYHMDYPSNEGALMTIGFLTFAVFLIKLVLKLIYALKLKQQYYYVQNPTTTPASIFLKRDERGTDQEQLEESARILRYLEEYSPS